MLHELVTGRYLFKRADDVATVAAVFEGNVPPLRALRPDVPSRLDDLVRRVLSADPALRPPSAAALADELDQVVYEAGNRFATMESGAQHLLSLGARLTPQPPGPIVETHRLVQAAPRDDQPNDPAGAGSATLVEIVAPPGGTCAEHLAGQHKVVLRSIAIDTRQRAPVPLEFGATLLPAPLRISVPAPGSLVVEAEPAVTPDGRSRMGLYHNADDPPEKRRASITIHASARGLRFYVGHRRARLHPLQCDSARGNGKEPIRVSLSGTPLAIVSQEPVSQLAVLYTTDDDNTIHAACVSVL